MAEISAELALEIKEFLSGIQKAQRAAQGFKQQAAQGGGNIGRGIAGGIGSAGKLIGKAVIGAVAAAGAVAGAVGGATIVSGLRRAMEDEQLKVAMEVLVGDTDKAKAVIEEIRTLGARTPLEFPDLANAGRALLAFGESADEVPDTLRRIGDVSTGIGAKIGEIAEIYGKARVQGTLFAQDINQLTGRGIPVIQEFAKQLGVSEGEVKKLGSQGKLTFTNLEQAFKDLTGSGGMFNGMMEKQSRTFGGLLSTFKDNWGNVLLALGEPIRDSLKPMLESGIDLVVKLQDKARKIGEGIADGVRLIVSAAQVFKQVAEFGKIGELLSAALRVAFLGAINLLYRGGAAAMSAMVAYMIEGTKNTLSLLSVLTDAKFWTGLGNALLGIAKMFAAAMMRHISNAITAIKEATGSVGQRILGGSDESLRETADKLDASAKPDLKRAGADLEPTFNKIGERMRKTGEAVAGAFSRTFKNTTDIFDTSGDSAILKDVVAQIRDTAAELKKAQQGTEKTTGAAGEGGVTSDAKTGGLPAINSRLSGAINTIVGRSANAVIANEAAKTSKNTERTAKAAEQIAANTKPNRDAKPTVRFDQQGAGRFI